MARFPNDIHGDVNLNNYCFDLELPKSMFFIDMLKGDGFKFTLKGDEIEIFSKRDTLRGCYYKTTREELIYYIQVEMAIHFGYSYLKEKTEFCLVPGKAVCDFSEDFWGKISNEERLVSTFYNLFETIDSIHKAIDNIVYLEKHLDQIEYSEGWPDDSDEYAAEGEEEVKEPSPPSEPKKKARKVKIKSTN